MTSKVYYNGPRQGFKYGGMSMGTTLGTTMGQKPQMKTSRMRTALGDLPTPTGMRYGGKTSKKRKY